MELNNKTMTTTDLIKLILQLEHQNMVSLAGLMHTTPQNVSQRLKKGNFRESDLTAIGDLLGYDVVIEFVKREE